MNRVGFAARVSVSTQRLRRALSPTERGWMLPLYQILFGVALLAVWEFVSGRYIDPFWFSKPSHIWALFLQEIQNGRLLTHLQVTLSETFTGFPLGALSGLTAGFLLGRWTTLAQIVDPYILGVYGIPRIALAPLFIVWFGIGPLSKIMLVAMVVFFLTFFNTYAGVRSVGPELINVARVMGANERKILLKVILPASSPWIFTGLKMSVPYSLVGALVGEFMASNKGLGYMIMLKSNLFDTTGVLVGILTIMIIVILLNSVLNRVERHVLRWRPQEGERRSTTGGW